MDAQKEMPKYRSHKTVWALRVKSVDGLTLTFEEPGYAPETKDVAWMANHAQQAGGYLVVYPDGYASWSPAAAFEEGYTLIESDA